MEVQVRTVIETERLALTPWKASDADQALSIYRAPQVARWMTPDLQSIDTSHAMGSVLQHWSATDGSGATGHWAARLRTDATLVGGVALQLAPGHGESVFITWQFAPQAWGQGYATEASVGLIHWAIHECGLTEVFALVQPDNARAAATAERIGMEWVAELGHLANGRYQVYRIRHGDLDYRD
ncbi:GNAT family N-acetyltransferase [Alloalcanivorax gelatiniphagus]